MATDSLSSMVGLQFISNNRNITR